MLIIWGLVKILAMLCLDYVPVYCNFRRIFNLLQYDYKAYEPKGLPVFYQVCQLLQQKMLFVSKMFALLPNILTLS